MQKILKARLHPHWVGGETGYVYSVICKGKLLVERSRDPECDAVRALLARGITGKLSLCDGKTGKPRTMIDIERAAKMTVEEAGNAPRFRQYRKRRGSEGYRREYGSSVRSCLAQSASATPAQLTRWLRGTLGGVVGDLRIRRALCRDITSDLLAGSRPT